MAQKHSLIRTIYLYLFTLVGLALLITGTVRFLDMGLKMFVFTKAEDPEKIQRGYYYPSLPIPVEKIGVIEESGQLTEEEIASLKSWLADYQKWQEEEAKIDYLASKRHREASINLAMILVGLPLYFYHWRIIRKEVKNA
jgi:hypothetical protein